MVKDLFMSTEQDDVAKNIKTLGAYTGTKRDVVVPVLYFKHSFTHGSFLRGYLV